MSGKKVEINPGLEKYQNKMREESLQNVVEALEEMRETGVKINHSSLARESGISRTTLYSSHIQEHLMQQPEFNKNLPQPSVQLLEYSKEAFEAIRVENMRLKTQLVICDEKIVRLQEQLKQKKDRRRAEKISEMERRGNFIIEQNHNRVG